jgi:hypothetical protein
MTKRWAEIENGVVKQVIVSETKPSDNYIETFKYSDDNPRKNYAGIGFMYDSEKDWFYSAKPFESWILDDNAVWQAPTQMPDDGKMYSWDEDSLSWIEITMEGD